MMNTLRLLLLPLFALAAALVGNTAAAAPIEPTADAQVVEILPVGGAERAESRRLRRALQDDPHDADSAAALARRLLSQARAAGDPRLAGQALAALQAWSDPATAPDEVLLMQASVQQYLHEFDQAAALLERLLARQSPPPQAWLTLATVRRVQGRYADSDRACLHLLALAVRLYGAACRAENDALRGEFDGARQQFQALLAQPRLASATRSWLLTSLAELEQRAGRPVAADAAFQAALATQPDGYALVDYADFLIEQRRPADALVLLRREPRTDAVLLRLAIAGARSGAPQAAQDAQEMRERIAQADLRPQAQGVHAREQAMFALWVEADPQRALTLARANVRRQREPVDLLVLERAGRAARQPSALREAQALRQEIGLHDRRTDTTL